MLAYCQTLGISENFSLSELKQSYKSLAKKWHPDINTSPDAKEKFQQISEAYEYLLALKNGKISNTVTDTSNSPTEEDILENIRKKAHAYANMSFKEFQKTTAYQASFNRFVFWTHLYIFSLILIPLFPLIGFLKNGWLGLIAPCTFLLILLPYWIGIKRRLQYWDLNQFKESVFFLLQFTSTKLIILILYNLIVFTNTTIKTVFPTLIIISSAILLSLLIFLTTYLKKLNIYKRLLWSLSLFTLINTLMLINRVTAIKIAPEAYYYTPTIEKTGNYSTFTTLIKLNNNTYNKATHIRVFLDYYSIMQNNAITYNFSKGILGLKFLNNYKLHP